jgi:hypothetical protein
MSAGLSVAFPGGRTLAAWWRQLAGYHPEALWVGYLAFHRLEALVCAVRPQRLPHFELLVLKALASAATPAIADAARRLQLDPGLLQRVLRHLQGEGLLNRSQGISDLGRQALEVGEYLRPRRERRVLYFWHGDWTMPPSSRFVPLPHPDKIAWLLAPETPFAVKDLHCCLRQSPEWKQRHGFPPDIRDLLAEPPGDPVKTWDQVMLATPLRCFAALARTCGADSAILAAWAVNTRNWEMQANHPAFVVPDEPPGWFPPPCPESAWRRAFVEWCLQRQVPEEDAGRCNLTVRQDRLFVEVPGDLHERLRGGRGEAWLLAGDGAVRPASRLEFV